MSVHATLKHAPPPRDRSDTCHLFFSGNKKRAERTEDDSRTSYHEDDPIQPPQNPLSTHVHTVDDDALALGLDGIHGEHWHCKCLVIDVQPEQMV